jgi:hypothetical protein
MHWMGHSWRLSSSLPDMVFYHMRILKQHKVYYWNLLQNCQYECRERLFWKSREIIVNCWFHTCSRFIKLCTCKKKNKIRHKRPFIQHPVYQLWLFKLQLPWIQTIWYFVRLLSLVFTGDFYVKFRWFLSGCIIQLFCKKTVFGWLCQCTHR